MVDIFKRLFMEEEGQGMTEYALILGLIAVAIIAAFAVFGPQLNTLIDNIFGNMDIPGTGTDSTTTTTS